MSNLPLILVVDDEPQIQRFLKPSLTASGYAVRTALTAAEAVADAASHPPALIILDLGLPDADGRDVIQRVRGWSDVPIIVLSAREAEAEKIAALDAGANDYVNKPFAMGELLARIRVALRSRPTGPQPPARLEIGDLVIDLAAHKVTRAGTPIHLTPKEFDLLALLAKTPGRLLTHRQLLTQLWGPAHVEDIAYLRVCVRQLRSKLDMEGAAESLIRTESGVGYRLEVGPQ